MKRFIILLLLLGSLIEAKANCPTGGCVLGPSNTEAEIQTAITTTAAPGERVILQAGQYSFTTPLVINKAITLEGATTNFKIADTLYNGAAKDLSNLGGTLLVVSTVGFKADGGTIDVCSATACGEVTYTNISGNTFTGCSTVSGTGALNQYSFVGQGTCLDLTFIKCNNSNGALQINANNVIVKGLSFVLGDSVCGGAPCSSAGGWIRSNSTSYRFFNNHLGQRPTGQGLRGVHFGPAPVASAGVIDHNIIDLPNQVGSGVSQIQNKTGGPGDGGLQWDKPSDTPTILDATQPGDVASGTGANIYGRGGKFQDFYENNYCFSRTSAMTWDGQAGARFTLRYNVIFNLRILPHGTEGTARGVRRWEAYNNTLVAPTTTGSSHSTRAGSFLFANNIWRGPSVTLNSNADDLRVTGADYSASGRLGSCYGWNPFDSNDTSDISDTSDGTFNSSVVPTATMASPFDDGGPFIYTPSNGLYVQSTVNTATNPTTDTLNPVITDNSKSWQTNQWVRFAVARVKGNGSAAQPSGLTISAVGGGPIDLSTMKGQGSIQVASGLGNQLFTNGTPPGELMGVITIPGSPPKYIVFQKRATDVLSHCWSPTQTGSIPAGTAAETGDMWFGNITASDLHTLTLNHSGSDGNKKLTKFINGDKYVIARVLQSMDGGGRGTSDIMGITTDPTVYSINIQRGTGGQAGGIADRARNTMDPFYVFNNVRPVSGGKTTFSAGSWTIVANRDYFTDNPLNSSDYTNYQWNSTTQVGQGVAIGTVLQRPSGSNYAAVSLGDITGATTNPPSVGYWAKDATNTQDSNHDGVLYALTAPSTWTKWWQPYIYPHPLVQPAGPPTPVISSGSSAQFTVNVPENCTNQTNCFNVTTANFTTPPTLTIGAWSPSTPGSVSFSSTAGTGIGKFHGDASTAAQNTYTTTILATGTGGESDSQPFNLIIKQDNQAPAITLTTADGLTSYSTADTVTLQGNASDSDGTVTQVVFKDGATTLGTTVFPTPFTWSTTFTGTGIHTLTAIATDDGTPPLSKTSAALAITIQGTSATPTPPAQIIKKP